MGELQNRRYWLLKTEPSEWSWDHQSANGGLSIWDGVKNAQAQKNLRAMKIHDLCFFYHSGSKAREIVGVVEVLKEFYDSEKEGEPGMVEVKEVAPLKRPISLAEMKGEECLGEFALFRQPRLSVVPVPEGIWKRICETVEFEEPEPEKAA
ncbi:hypothetical protein AMTRI_Chr12g272550 [Amborella trichopoda]